MEGLDLAPDGRAAVGQLVDRRDLDAFTGQILAGPVRREHLDAERLQLPGECRDPRPIRD
jgi:hypothetical protein